MLRLLHIGAAALFFGAIVVQVFLAGLAIPQLGGSGSFSTHAGFGYLIGLFALILVLAAVIAGAGRTRVLQALGLLGLYIIQTILPNLDPGFSIGAALHPVNAMLMFSLSGWYLWQLWRERAAADA